MVRSREPDNEGWDLVAYFIVGALLAVMVGVVAAAIVRWGTTHAVREVPRSRTCYVAPIRGGGGLVTVCEPAA